MRDLTLEFPPGVLDDRATQLLNERLRLIQENLGIAETVRGDLNLKGYRIVELGNAKEGGDALSRNAADARYPVGALSGNSNNNGGSGVGSSATGDSGANLLLFAPGTLAIDSNVAPLVSLPRARTIEEIVALVKTPPAGGSLTLRLEAGARQVATVTIGDSQSSGRLNGAGLQPFPANQVCTLAITSVGLTFPGADLSVIVRFE